MWKNISSCYFGEYKIGKVRKSVYLQLLLDLYVPGCHVTPIFHNKHSSFVVYQVVVYRFYVFGVSTHGFGGPFFLKSVYRQVLLVILPTEVFYKAADFIDFLPSHLLKQVKSCL